MSIEDFERIVAGEEPLNPYNKRVSPELAKQALEAGRRTAQRYGGPEKLLPESDLDWGMAMTKGSAERQSEVHERFLTTT
jgi:hypothetical protein